MGSFVLSPVRSARLRTSRAGTFPWRALAGSAAGCGSVLLLRVARGGRLRRECLAGAHALARRGATAGGGGCRGGLARYEDLRLPTLALCASLALPPAPGSG